MKNNYLSKIKSREELKKIIGSPPRKKTVVMCHGTFDIVHPGHLRHLMYAREKGDVLIATLTADRFIDKGMGRPFVPEDLRAKNLAAIEFIDYVVIDYEKKPLKNIKYLKPDIFLKGFEYTKDGLHPNTQEEVKAVSSYGGKVMFSPGDIVYSSTHLLSVHKPRISIDKLVAVMEAEGVTFEDVLEYLQGLDKLKVHVIGDTIVDKYSYCSVLGPSTKTPTFSVKLNESKSFVGGAGVVAKHLKSLGADVTFTTVLGDDDMGAYVQEDLKKWGIKTHAIVDDTRPTTVKERFWADGYKLLQVDVVDNRIVSDDVLKKIGQSIKKHKADIVVYSDFRHGIFQEETIKYLDGRVPKKTVRVADSQVSNRWGNILEFKGADIIFPNEKEARFALGDQDTAIRPLAEKLYRKSKAKYLVLKLGEAGLILYRERGSDPRNFIALESFVEELVDGIGAGDALLAAATLVYRKTGDIFTAALAGNLAAAIACETEGNVPVSVDKIREKIEAIRRRELL